MGRSGRGSQTDLTGLIMFRSGQEKEGGGGGGEGLLDQRL